MLLGQGFERGIQSENEEEIAFFNEGSKANRKIVDDPAILEKLVTDHLIGKQRWKVHRGKYGVFDLLDCSRFSKAVHLNVIGFQRTLSFFLSPVRAELQPALRYIRARQIEMNGTGVREHRMKGAVAEKAVEIFAPRFRTERGVRHERNVFVELDDSLHVRRAPPMFVRAGLSRICSDHVGKPEHAVPGADRGPRDHSHVAETVFVFQKLMNSLH